MNVRQLIQHLVTLDMDAEIMIDAPLDCAKNDRELGSSSLTIPVRALSVGTFQFGSGEMTGRPWVMINGTAVWGRDDGVLK